MSTKARPEQEAFDDLAALCISPGYVHAIAFLCYRDSLVRYSGEIRAEDMQHLYSTDRLIRTEIATLIGLMIKGNIDCEIPSPDILQQYIDKTEALPAEIHKSVIDHAFGGWDLAALAAADINPFARGQALREAMFYSGESAYSFQYRDLSSKKYEADDDWLKSVKGFSIHAARDVVDAVRDFQGFRATEWIDAMRRAMPEPAKWTLLPNFSFTREDISKAYGLDEELVENVLGAFTIQEGQHNQDFRSLNDFNVINAAPLIRDRDGAFVLFEQYGLASALYEGPFYWMCSDQSYLPIALKHRGQFTEDFSAERLRLVFGDRNVHLNVGIISAKGEQVGEIDVLVLFGNRAIVLEAKSKRLTLEARRGNDRVIKEDFQKSIQDAYDQSYKCAQLLSDPALKFVAENTENITIPSNFKEIYTVCVVCDHYPALNFQARQFLKVERTQTIQPPLIMDIFALDAMTEMLQSPLRFLSYLNRRSGYYDRLLAANELTILSYHLKTNLWIEDRYDQVMLHDDISIDLDVAMSVRRDNVPGKRTPEGVLTRITGTAVGRLIDEIESSPNSQTIEFGLMLLRLSERTVLHISAGIETILRRERKDGRGHDMTIPVGEGRTGLTIHSNSDPIARASHRLGRHCEVRKYTQKASTWYGICISPTDGSLRFGLNLDHEWKPDAEMDNAVRSFPFGKRQPGKAKVGRNDPCPCNSGLKFKKCHGKL